MFREGIMDVLRACVHGDSIRRQYRTEDGVRNVVSAVTMGLCVFVPDRNHAVTMLDRHWPVTVGIELTDFGREQAGR